MTTLHALGRMAVVTFVAALSMASHPAQPLMPTSAAALAQGTPAAEAEENTDLVIVVLHCAAAPAPEEFGAFFASGVLPAGCAPGVGVSVAVEDNATPLPGSPFATDVTGALVLPVPVGSSLSVSEDPASLPPGYEALTQAANGVPYANPVRLDAVEGGGAVLFVNVPAPVAAALAQATPIAQEAGPTDLTVVALHCAVPPLAEALASFLGTGALPQGCAPAVGVAVAVAEDGEPLASSPFRTDVAGGLQVPVNLGAAVEVREDPASLPSGYVPLDVAASGVPYANPVRLDAAVAGAVVLFVNVPAPVATALAADTSGVGTPIPGTPIASGTPTAGASDTTSRDDGSVDVVVAALNCDEAPEATALSSFFAGDPLPSSCTPAVGAAVLVAENGAPLSGSPFTIEVTGIRGIRVDQGSSVEVREDPASLPASYAPLDREANGVAYANPVRLDTVTERTNVLFVNLPRSAPSAPQATAGPALASASDRTGCDPSYPDERTCIPTGPPLDPPCSITDERNFTVLPPDPRGLDSDGDGIGCEPISP